MLVKHLLLDYAAELPELRRLHIFVAGCNANREARCGRPAMHYSRHVRRQIEVHLMAFAPVDPEIHLPEITAPGQIYKIMQNQQGELRYCPTLEHKRTLL